MSKQGSSPLPLRNHRFQNATPQTGVEVERKWKRADYRMPGSSNGNKSEASGEDR